MCIYIYMHNMTIRCQGLTSKPLPNRSPENTAGHPHPTGLTDQRPTHAERSVPWWKWWKFIVGPSK